MTPAAAELERTVDSAAAAVRDRLGRLRPRVALILGTGLGGLIRHIAQPVEIPYDSIPGFPLPTVRGHAGRAVAGSIGTTDVLVYAGRFHLYEGHSSTVAALPVRVARALGAR
ncbi:MAG: purine-nucleoside phosphorylase, partial [Gemmatimonadaceae bacterium]